LVRTDLSPGQQVVQACHAAWDACSTFHDPGHEHPHLVVCGVPDESTLKHVLEQLRERGVRLRAFTECDIGNELTALASEPLAGAARRPFRKYRLLNPGLLCAAHADGPRECAQKRPLTKED
jgi:hypothetical protein